jgi:YHS domain-containing protein
MKLGTLARRRRTNRRVGVETCMAAESATGMPAGGPESTKRRGSTGTDPATSERMDKDPVCGAAVSRDDVAGQSRFQGKTYYFCSPRCKERFDADPQSYRMRRLSDRAPRSLEDEEH